MHQSEAERLEVSWKAFSSSDIWQGWRTIPLATRAPCVILAGRHFPGGEEAVLIGFRTAPLPTQAALPQGSGFSVTLAADVGAAPSKRFVALSRRPHASREMFTMMAADVLAMLDRHADASEGDLMHLFLGRIRGWQEFMERGAVAILGRDAELGLAGELVLFRRLIEEGISPRVALDAWQGSQRGLHDFVFGTGAIEVKSTAASGGFPARVGSLDQFDETIRQSLFCCAVRFAEGTDGATLPEYIEATACLMHGDQLALGLFETRVLQAGYVAATAEGYSRRLRPLDIRLLRIEGRFPRLTASTVPAGVLRARYDVDLDLIALEDVGLVAALKQLTSG